MTAPRLTREQILARKTGKGIATLPDGSTVAIRALTHAEVIEGQGFGDLNARTCWMVAHALTDPKMSVEDVQAWAAEAGAGDLVAVSEQVQVLSGLVEGAGKSGVPAPRG
jgi:hypothetical protein